MIDRGIEQLDFVYVCGDAYVDHPSFGHAIIARILESHGYTVGIISQPDWKDDASVSILGTPRLAFIVTAGNMDSMVNHYSVSKKRRAMDSYTPGGVMGKRPDYATVVYCNLIRHTYKNTPIIIGGIEASLRRMAHYDYWSNKVKRSILLDSGADLISYGMGEQQQQQLEAGSIDFAFANAPLPAAHNFATIKVQRENFYAFYNAGFAVPWANKSMLSPEDLAGVPLCCNYGSYALLRNVFKDYAVKPNVAFIATTAESALTFATSGLGVAVVAALEGDAVPQEMVRQQLVDEKLHFDQTLYWSKEHKLSPAAEGFLEFFRNFN